MSLMFPKPTKAKKTRVQKRKARDLHDPEHMAKVAQLPCVITGRSPVEVHHVIHGRFSQLRASDRATIPLCPEEHLALHAGKEAWAAKHGPDYTYIADTLEAIKRMEALTI